MTNTLCPCLQKCPFDAIMIINLPKNLEKETTHRYGPNAFKLHRLPVPRPGQVGAAVRGWRSGSVPCKVLRAAASSPLRLRLITPSSIMVECCTQGGTAAT